MTLIIIYRFAESLIPVFFDHEIKTLTEWILNVLR